MDTPPSGTAQAGPASFAAAWAMSYRRAMIEAKPQRRSSPPPLPRRAQVGSLLDELGHGLLNLSMTLHCIEHALTDVEAFTAEAMRVRIHEVIEVASALEQVYLDAADVRVAALLLPDAAFAEYLRRVLAWSQGILRAFEDLAAGLKSGAPAWALFDRRLADAAAVCFDDLGDKIRDELVARGLAGVAIGDHVEDLVAAASALERRLSPR